MGPVTDLARRSVPSDEKEDLPLPPTQYSFFTLALDSIVRAPSLDSLRSAYPPIEPLLDTGGAHRGLWWLDISAPSDDDIDTLSRIFDIHPLTTEDIKIREAREKIELFGPYYFLSLRPPQQIETVAGKPSSLNVYAVVFNQGVLSFTFGNSPHPGHVWRRIREHRSHLSLTSDWICYALIDDIVDGFAPFIDRVETGVEMMDDSVSITRPDDIGLALQNIYHLRKEVTRIRQLLNDKTDVIRSFARHCDGFEATPSQVALYLSDIQDHVLTMMANLANAEQMLSRSQSKYLSQISFDSTRMRNEIAAALSRLTVIACCIVPMQFFTGMMGMNVLVPGKDVEGLQWWLGILGLILGLILLLFLIAKKTRAI